jgi:hypothetical protein
VLLLWKNGPEQQLPRRSPLHRIFSIFHHINAAVLQQASLARVSSAAMVCSFFFHGTITWLRKNPATTLALMP